MRDNYGNDYNPAKYEKSSPTGIMLGTLKAAAAVIEALEALDGEPTGDFYLSGRIDLCLDDVVVGCIVPIDDWWEFKPVTP